YPTIRPRASEIADLLQFNVDEHSRAVSGLLNALYLFNTPQITKMTERSDFSILGIGSQPTLLIIGASLADALASETMSSIMLNQIFSSVYRRFGHANSATSTPIYFIIDESARLKDRINYEEVLSVARSARV